MLSPGLLRVTLSSLTCWHLILSRVLAFDVDTSFWLSAAKTMYTVQDPCIVCGCVRQTCLHTFIQAFIDKGPHEQRCGSQLVS